MQPLTEDRRKVLIRGRLTLGPFEEYESYLCQIIGPSKVFLVAVCMV